MIVEINTVEEYRICRDRGYEPLNDQRFVIPIRERYYIQNEVFKSDVAFYKHAYQVHPTKCCEECGKPLHEYSAVWVSHILSRGAHPEMRYDLRNYNLLCGADHAIWEVTAKGVKPNRYGMRIYERNAELMEQLIEEYRELKQIPQF